MPCSWIPPYNTPPWDSRSYEWEVSGIVRSKLLGPSMSMLVAAYQAYLLLPHRIIGCMPSGPPQYTITATLVVSGMGAEGHAMQLSLASANANSDQAVTPPVIPGGVQQHQQQAEENVHATQIAEQNEPAQNASATNAHFTQATSVASAALEEGLRDVPLYYSSKHFLRVGAHAYSTWDDCMWLLLLQEPAPLPSNPREDNPAASLHSEGGNDESSSSSVIRGIINFLRGGAREYRPGCCMQEPPVSEESHGTAFRDFEKELLLMKPFLMYVGVFAGMMAVNNKSYAEAECSQLIHDLALDAGFRFVSRSSVKRERDAEMDHESDGLGV